MDYRLKNKKLLVLTGCNGDNHIIDFAKRSGVYTIATDYNVASKVKERADLSFNISTADVDAIEELARSHEVDGITTGTSEVSMHTVLEVTNRLCLPFYASKEQLNTINDKTKFKKLLKAHDLRVPKQCSPKSIEKFPVIVKPVDSSGSKGISVCGREATLPDAVDFARRYSRSGEVLIEDFIDNQGQEFFANYTIIDGVFSLSCAFDNYKKPSIRGFGGDALINYFPSAHLDRFRTEVHPKIEKALSSIDLKNGVLSIQSIFDGKEFYIYEAGYRLGGSQSYVFTKHVNGISHLEMMVRFALTGRMTTDSGELQLDNPHFRIPCCQRNIAIRPGRIKEIVGLDKVLRMSEVLNVTQNLEAGDVVSNTGTSSRLALRIHFCGKNRKEISNVLDEINATVSIIDADDNDMVIDRPQLADFLGA